MRSRAVRISRLPPSGGKTALVEMLRSAGKEAFAAAASAFRVMLASPIITATRPPSFVADNSPATAVLERVDKMLVR
eukprot:3505907-Pleurochrysis_carterae.AAC.1